MGHMTDDAITPRNEGLEPSNVGPALIELAKLLMDEERLLILGQAALHRCSLDDLAQRLPIKRAALVKGLRNLREAGLIQAATVDGTEVYALNRRELQRLKQAWFARPQPAEVQTPETKILAAFVKDGRLTGFPMHPAKRDVVMRWLADDFAEGRTYTEKEVNEILRRRFDDTATLRRYLVDFGFLARDHGVYWKLGSGPQDK
jgi:hypothetical protein